MNKTCSVCKETKAVTMFYKQKSSKDGYRAECISCKKLIHSVRDDKRRQEREWLNTFRIA